MKLDKPLSYLSLGNYKSLPLSKKVRIISLQTEILRTITAIAAAYLAALVLLCFVCEQPFEAFHYLLLGPFMKSRYMNNVLAQSVPLMFTGVSLAIMLRAGQMNLGGEGAFICGSITAALVAIGIKLPVVIHPLFAVALGGTAGALICGVPAVLKTKLGINELVISLMMNYIALGLANLLLRAFIMDETAGILTSKLFNETASMGGFSAGLYIQYGLLLAIITVVSLSVYLFRTRAGYSMRMAGLNSSFARFSGMSAGSIIMTSQLIGGAAAGVGGAVYTLSNLTRQDYMSGFANKGFDGMIVSILARNNPFLVPFSALFLAYIREGAEIMSRQVDNISFEIMSIIQGIIIIVVTAEALFANLKTRRIVKEA